MNRRCPPGVLPARVAASLLLALWLAAAAGCYLSHGGPQWSAQAETIAVPLVVSHLRSDELTRSLEARVTAELRRRASQGDLGGLTLAHPGAADLTLAVELVEAAQKVIRVDTYNVPIERQVVYRADYRLVGVYGEILAQGVADSRVSALAGNYDISRGENSEQGRDSAIQSLTQAIIEAINDDRLQAADAAAGKPAPGPAPGSAPAVVPAPDVAPAPAPAQGAAPGTGVAPGTARPPAPPAPAAPPAPEPPPAFDLPSAPVAPADNANPGGNANPAAPADNPAPPAAP